MLTTLKVGGRVLKAGQRVKIKGERGGMFKIVHFDDDGKDVVVYGGKNGHAKMRTFPVDRIGERPRALNKELGHL